MLKTVIVLLSCCGSCANVAYAMDPAGKDATDRYKYQLQRAKSEQQETLDQNPKINKQMHDSKKTFDEKLEAIQSAYKTLNTSTNLVDLMLSGQYTPEQLEQMMAALNQ